ncbi:MAG TPA: MBL fold metallo-hydrolase [Thermoanaerobaculia bacterium]|nr:MBL fold metallo-hydrolase [Thermoanaerobaculia bacterium]
MDKEFFTLTTPHFTIEGRSRAGHETFFRIRDLGVALDIGRCPDMLVHMPHVFITHAHLDHAVGIPFYAGQRHLQRLHGGRVYVPSEAAEDVRTLLGVYEKMANTRFEEIEVIGVAAGQDIRFGRSHLARAHAASHRIAARAYEFIEVRHHLRDEFADRDVGEIARLRRDGAVVDEEYRRSVLFYTGDTDRGMLETCDAMYRAEVLLIECSFIAEGHQDRAAKYRHIHLDDLVDFAGRFENELVILTHFSRRYSREEIRDAVRRRLPHALRERVRLALPEPWQRL